MSEKGKPNLKEITIETEAKVDGWTSSIPKGTGATVKIVDCRPHGRKGTMKYIEVSSRGPVKDVLRAISVEPNITYSTFNVFDKYRASGIITTKDSPVCRAACSVMSFCRHSAMEASAGKENPAKWRITFSGKTPLNNFLAQLKREGVKATVTEYGNPTNNRVLTFEQNRAVGLAEEEGYFRFPRDTSLKELSRMLGISPSTLDEIIRRAEGKIVGDYTGKPRRAPRG